MDVEWSPSVVERARSYAALGEPARVAIVDRLLVGDASPTELGRQLGLPSNLLAHHLKLLEQAGLVVRRRSDGDHRRSYLRLNPDPLTGLIAPPGGVRVASRVVFVCTRNSARSPLAAALWKRHSRVSVAAAGTDPAARIDPRAVAVADAHGLSLGRARTRDVREVARAGDLVVAVCDAAHEQLDPLLPVSADRLHWSVPDPASAGTARAYDSAFQELAGRIDRLAPTVHPSPRSAS